MGTYSNITIENDQFYSLEKHFEIACNRHPHLKLLESQWRFDQELISKALQNIGSIFPHYSRHDASHSRQIIVNIERILGDKIRYLTATDTWLILEAAYSHDIGMVITQKQIEDMNTPDFQEFVTDLSKDKNHYLHQFAENWLADKAILPQQAHAHDFFQNYLQLLAEWYRQKHPKNSARIVRSPVEEIGLNSPRNELLPKRLFSILADICEAHGHSFKELMDQLPQAEAGMASEDCHPRYVACLLRMGDLLDVDDNRFCPVMMAMCGHNMPKLSKTHYDKHQAIQHLRMDAERIEIKCICPTLDSYEETYGWFDWLQQEYYKQTQHWHKIVPSSELGRLPTLMTPVVEMDEPYIILDEGKKPTLKVNKDSFLNLVRGTGLYSSKFDAIREILQNAVDSTLHRIWIEHKDDDKDEFKEEYKIENPTSSKLLEISDKYYIDISFEPHKDKKEIWVLKIKDKGIGISFNDLKYILEVGSSSKNKEKAKRAESMPMWFRPSGAFGIGLQSAFLLADQFTLITYSMLDQQKLKIIFNKEKNNILLEKQSSKNMKYGTEFIIEIKVDGIPKRLSHIFEKNNELSKIYSSFDITNPDLSRVEIFNIQQNIHDFFENSLIKSNLTVNDRVIQNGEYDIEEMLIIKDVKFGEFTSHYFNDNFFFRGQKFGDLNLIYTYVSFNIDFYHTTSDKFLNYNREKIKPEIKNETNKKVIRAMKKFIENNFDKLSESEKPYAAFSYIVNFREQKYEEIPIKFKENVLLLPININDENIFLEALLNKIRSGEITKISVKSDSNIPSGKLKKVENCITNLASDQILYLIKYILTKEKFYYSDVSLDMFYNTIQFTKDDIQPVSREEFKRIIQNKNGSSLSSIGCRKVFPAWIEYRKLTINKSFDWVDIYRHDAYQSEYLVLPLNFKYEKNHPEFYDYSDAFNHWVYDHRKNLEVTFDQIKNLNNQLIDFIKEILI
ncbi:ATP-binding protein [Acinetobacter sp. V91_7]|uniref:HD domain-containing protein n=1 Tax=unclassified Acinetobacter TaxID=196816 RepID=UPI00287EF84C|nr:MULTISPECIES: ATP-binding protein [unclassified Acinetobacter]MDS7932631.1 ATP-binding protein [Acinetobacter sp. V91_4B]MDS7963215.1 ATP-binding protein [Acinetobacter sp. V91_7]MDS8028309.1 ATP-binding protein [Acinetobacter sp. V91_13]